MRLKKLFLSALILLGTMLTAVAQMQMPTLPVDKDVRIGKLSNGLTYYIRYNNWPENRAEFYIAQRVGSLQEDEPQRGLAHFLEHMCFNGTKHFKGNDLIRYCESIGVQFGRDLNAYTSIDQTVYNISNVPTTRQSALDSCLLILYDWADGLMLDPAEIDKERGVIHEEWRMRSSASQRMFERALPTLYPGSKYGLRMPIGLMSVIDNFKPQTLRDYYEKWYRPDNQAIIVVGDIDVDHVEAEIKRLFSGIVLQADAAPVVKEPVPDNAEPIVVIEKDKEQRTNTIDLIFKHEAMPDSIKNTIPYLVSEYVKNTAIRMLNARLEECAQKPESPFVSSSAYDGDYIFASTVQAFDIDALPKEGQTEAALAAIYREALRVAKFGFTPTEYNRAKANAMSALDKSYSNKDKRYSRQFCDEYKEHYLANEPIPSIDDYYATMKQVIPMIPVEAVNQVMAMLIPANDSNMVILSFNNEKEGNVYPTKENLLKAIADVRTENLQPYVDNVKDEPLISTLPKKGSIKSEKENTQFGYKELMLSNGVKVILKKTDYKQDQVLLSMEGYGGSSLYDKADYTNLKVFDDVVEASGLGNFSHTELEKALAGKIVSASMSLGSRRQRINGSSTPNDVETLLQLVYLYFTKINKDEESFANLMKTYEISLKNKALSPESAFNDSVTVTMNCHNPRFTSVEANDLKDVNYDRILEIAKQLTSNAAAYTVTIVGNFDEAAIRPLLEQYIASLPSQKKIVKGKNVDTDATGVVVNSFKRKMETPKAISMMIWTNKDIPYTLDNKIKTDIAGQVLSMIYLKKIREDASAAYSVGAQGSIRRIDKDTDCTMFAYCPMKPEKGETALSIMRDEMEQLAKTCDADMLTKVKEYMLKSYDDRTKTNNYWNGILSTYNEYGIDMHTAYKATVQAQTPQTITAFMTEFLKAGNRIEVVMMPEE
ncbi:M16 family metallopeptidase [Xylanibacter rodentium]|uniref:Insulinase family protein n=1 Tax=Xylanibacter rodentium TaxID=2736289 RepID=A0ABX2AVV2_9BACT|nr:M16 family metallopeptidase [Xylanibacter rodentium]NPE11992.1 insulinase family protein [Prevotella sp. PJ1A]NPE14241.1 insulinase family protein [Xylanibacter rodentium]NPE39411.1 insulinase family protein [Prevotella sp. PCJ2]